MNFPGRLLSTIAILIATNAANATRGSGEPTMLEGHCKVGADRGFMSFQLKYHDENLRTVSVGVAMDGMNDLVYSVTAKFIKKDDASFEASFRIVEKNRRTGKVETTGSFSSINNEDNTQLVGKKLFLQRETATGSIITCLGKVLDR